MSDEKNTEHVHKFNDMLNKYKYNADTIKFTHYQHYLDIYNVSDQNELAIIISKIPISDLQKMLTEITGRKMYNIIVKIYSVLKIDLTFENNILIKVAIANDNYDVVKFIIDNAKNIDSDTKNIAVCLVATSVSSLKNSYAYFNLLLKHGADCNTHNSYVLRMCLTNYTNCTNNKTCDLINLVNLFIEYNANFKSLTPHDLYYIMVFQPTEIIELLIKNSVDFSIINTIKINSDTKKRVKLLKKNNVDMACLSQLLLESVNQ